MAKSLAITACMPSWPEMPMPTLAHWIMETSLAPSPMARVVPPSFCLTSSTMAAYNFLKISGNHQTLKSLRVVMTSCSAGMSSSIDRLFNLRKSGSLFIDESEKSPSFGFLCGAESFLFS
uniref:Uncharacterized protein n=1 Tax=Romanomermis culicivorax TaxID=13658 RepID=A0A915HGM9_ROMCU